MSIEYAYEIVSVDEAARCMEVIYTSEARQTLRIGARLPYEGELLESIIRMYAPLRYWEEQELKVVAPAVGTSGFLAAPVVSEAPSPTEQPVTPE